MTRLQTPRLVLEPLDGTVAAAIAAGDLSVLGTAFTPPLAAAPDWPHQDTEDNTLDAMRMVAKNGDPCWLVVADGVVVGECGTAGPITDEGDQEIGFGLAAGCRGRGYGPEVIAALSGHLLGDSAVRRVTAEVRLDNPASGRALEKAGFQRERVADGHAYYVLAAPATR
jgi:RimJ/RimL family protein N-acetyltransferase